MPAAPCCRFEVELPLVESEQSTESPATAETRKPSRQLTALLVEPDVATQRQLLVMLSSRGHRVVPVATGDEAADLAPRLRFDVALCSVRMAGMNWVEFFERARHQLGAFVLMTEGYDAELSRAFHGGEGFILRKPVNPPDLDRLLETIQAKPEIPPILKSGRW